MTLQLDHCFVLCDPQAPQADLLSDLGLIEGPGNDHPGQGTANRRFFFSNTMFEFLYVRDADEAVHGRAKGLRLPERAMSAAASPFGLIVRSSGGLADTPFPGWPYCPEYFPADQCFHVGENSDLLEEPLCICMPHNLPVPASRPRRANADMTLTGLRLGVPVSRLSPPLEAIAACDGVSLQLNEPHHLELVFNEERAGRFESLLPALPLTVRW
ncbi:MAG: hypothetical protein AAFX56_09445 [Pseudomonadota bacterium]